MSKENLISKESARAQLDTFLDYYGLSVEDIEIEDGVEAVNTLMNGLVRAIQAGNLEITEDKDQGFRVRQVLVRPLDERTELVYQDKIAAAKIAMDSAGKKVQLRIYSFLSALTGADVGELTRLKGEDVTTLNRISVLFSMV